MEYQPKNHKQDPQHAHGQQRSQTNCSTHRASSPNNLRPPEHTTGDSLEPTRAPERPASLVTAPTLSLQVEGFHRSRRGPAPQILRRMKALLIAAILTLSACGSADPTSIDGTGVGPEVRCNDSACVALMASVQAAAEAEVDPADPPVTKVHMYPYALRVSTGSASAFFVVVLDLQDGSEQVVRVGCGLGILRELANCGPTTIGA
jgi:hypothetical protein